MKTSRRLILGVLASMLGLGPQFAEAGSFRRCYVRCVRVVPSCAAPCRVRYCSPCVPSAPYCSPVATVPGGAFHPGDLPTPSTPDGGGAATPVPGAGASLDDRLKSLQDAGDYKGAVALLDAAIRRNPDDGELYARRVIPRLMTGNLKGALEDAEAGVSKAPRSALAYNARAMCHNIRALAAQATGDEDLRTQWYEAAIADTTRAVKLDPKSTPYRSNRAVFLMNLKRFDEALADWDKIVESDPENAQHYFDRGRVHHFKGDAAAADADLTRADELDPEIIEKMKARKEALDKANKEAIERATKGQ